jgi:acetyl-CoA C-acetyltransferase
MINGKKIVIGEIVRTPWGAEGGALRHESAGKLLTQVLQELVRRSKIDVRAIDAVTAGCCLQNSSNMNVARIAAQCAGLPWQTTDSTVHLNCVSGLESILRAVHRVLSPFDGDVYIASGVECMSSYGGRIKNLGEYTSDLNGVTSSLGKSDLPEKIKSFIERNAVDEMTGFAGNVANCIPESLTDLNSNMSMAECAEIMANIYAIPKEAQDIYSFNSLRKAVNAVEEGKLDSYVMGVTDAEGNAFNRDEYPTKRRRWLDKGEEFFTSKKPFINDGAAYLTPQKFIDKHGAVMKTLGYAKSAIDPSVTLWSSCGNADGAAACVITTEEKAKALGLKIKAEIVSWAYSGVHPALMGVGPLFSTQKALAFAGLKLSDMDSIEIHEPFATTVLAVMKEAPKEMGESWDPSRMNPYGGSLFYRHPLAATFFRLIANLFTTFDNNGNARYGLATCCAGGGLGGTLILRRHEDMRT